METQFNVLTMLFKRIKWHYLEEQLLHIRQSTAASFLKVFFPITSWWLLSELFLHFLCTFPAIPWNDLQLAILHLTHTRTLQMQSSGGCESQKAKVKKIAREWFWPEKWKWEWIWPQRCCRQNFEQPDRILRTTSWWFSWFVCFLLPLTAAPGRVWFLNWLDSCDCIYPYPSVERDTWPVIDDSTICFREGCHVKANILTDLRQCNFSSQRS